MYIVGICLVIACLAILDIYKTKYINHRTQKIILGMVFAFLLLRFNMGSDTRTYAKIYNELPNDIFEIIKYYNYRFPLFNILMKLGHLVGMKFHLFQLSINIIILLLCWMTICKYSSNYLLSLVILLGSGYIQVYYTSAIRQFLCMAIYLFVFYDSMYKKNWKKYFFVVILLCFIHEISIILLIIPGIYLFKKEKKISFAKFLILVGWIMIFLILNIFPEYFIRFLPQRIGYIFNKAPSLSTISILGVGLQIVSILLITFLYYTNKNKSDDLFFQYNVCLFSFAFYLWFIRFPLMSRVCDYILIIHIIYIPQLIAGTINKRYKMSGVLAIVLLNLVLALADTFDGMSHYYDSNPFHYPYVSIFNVDDAYKFYDFGNQIIK